MYQWRTLSDPERAEILASRQRNRWPAHSPPRWKQHSNGTSDCFHLTAACYEHAPLIGHTTARIDAFVGELLGTCRTHGTELAAWCVLPNHYHLLLKTSDLASLTRTLGQLHGRCSCAWNLEEDATGRKVFFRIADRCVRSDGHFWATLNYVHHNPVRHGYTTRWTDWPWSSAHEYLASTDREEAIRIWRAYPLHDYGQDWDEPWV